MFAVICRFLVPYSLTFSLIFQFLTMQIRICLPHSKRLSNFPQENSLKLDKSCDHGNENKLDKQPSISRYLSLVGPVYLRIVSLIIQ